MLMLQLNFLLHLIVQRYGQNANCALVISNSDELNIESDALPMVYLKLNDSVREFHHELTDVLAFGCQMFLFLVNDYNNAIDNLEEAIKLTDRRFGRRKLIFIPNPNHWQEARGQLLQVLENKSFEFVPDILLILPVENNQTESLMQDDKFLSTASNITFELTTHKYVGRTDHHAPVVLDYWSADTEEFLMNNDLFPNKMKNYQGRILKIAAFTYPPYSIIEGDHYDGTEMRLGLEYARQLNSSPEMVDDEEGEWGQIFDNRTGNGILGNLVMDNAEIGYAALYTWFHEYGFLDLSLPVVRTGITCLTPAPRLLTSWLAPLFPFTSYVWMALIVTEIVVILSIKFISSESVKFGNKSSEPSNDSEHVPRILIHDVDGSTRRRQDASDPTSERWVAFTASDSVITALALLLLQPFPSPMSAISASFKHLLLWLLVLALLITCSYSSGLATSMTIPRYQASIKTVQDLADYRMEWGATHDAWIFSILEATQPTIVQVLSQFRTHNDKELFKRTTTRDFAFSIERLPAGHFAIGSYITEAALPYLQAMQEDIYWEQCVIMMRKSSPHLEGMNALIGKMHSAGLMNIWESEVARKYLNYKVQLAVKLSLMQHVAQDNTAPVKLRTSHLKGMYILWLFGIGFSIICFITELGLSFHTIIKFKPKTIWQ